MDLSDSSIVLCIMFSDPCLTRNLIVILLSLHLNNLLFNWRVSDNLIGSCFSDFKCSLCSCTWKVKLVINLSKNVLEQGGHHPLIGYLQTW
jgi:hypothetical protein